MASRKFVPTLVAACLLTAAAAPAQTLTRKEVSTLTAAEVAAYRKGVAEMKKRPATDPTSWIYQANIHGTFDTPAQTSWSSCEHFSDFFLSWHRMYLHYFERILRKASGMTTFALPYWNYSLAANRRLPLIFRQPNSEAANPLFTPARAINGGQKLPAAATSVADVLGEPLFFSDAVPSFSAGLEGRPHGAVHNVVGGGSGWMSSFEMAGRDPIFWLHHANIDRLWESWVQAGHSNPGSGPWTTAKFTFFDEHGSAKELTGAEVVDIATQLGYRYDRLESAPGALTQPTAAPTSQQTIGTGPQDGVTLGATAGSVDVQLQEGRGSGALTQPSAKPSRYILQFTGIEAGQGAYYEIYVNLPPTAKNPQPTSPHFAGILSPFGKPHHTERRPVTSRVDVTRAVNRLRTAGRLGLSPTLRLTFVPRGPQGQAGALAPPATMQMRIGGIQLVLVN
jgi:tyrosinase